MWCIKKLVMGLCYSKLVFKVPSKLKIFVNLKDKAIRKICWLLIVTTVYRSRHPRWSKK